RARARAKGDLQLDSADAVRKGGATGPVVVPGKPDDSTLIRAVRHTDALRMPPKGKLPDAQVAILEEWVRIGAPYPRDPAGNPIAAAAPDHWAFRPVRNPSPPPATG